MGDDIETEFRLMSSTTLVERKSKQTTIDNRPGQMSSPINNPAYCELCFAICNSHEIVGIKKISHAIL